MARPVRLRSPLPATAVALPVLLLLLVLPGLSPAPASALPGGAQGVQPAWAKTVTWTNSSVDVLADLCISRDGANLWACGSTGPGDGDTDLALIRIPTSGARVYKYSWDGNALDDSADAVATAADGSVYTAGTTTRRLTGRDIVVVKWSRLGRLVRVMSYTPGRHWDATADVVVNRFGDVIVCGTKGGVAGSDWVVVSWSADGRRKWVRAFAGAAGGDDAPSEMVVDGEGCLYVTGAETRADGSSGIRTIKYDRAGRRLWTRAWSARESAGCTLGSIARRAAGGVYVGCSEAGGGAVVLRYTASGKAARVVSGTERFWVEDMAATSNGGWVLGGAGLAYPYVERYAGTGALLTGWLVEPPLDPEYPSDIRRVAADTAGRVYWAGFASRTQEVLVGCRPGTAGILGWDSRWTAGYDPVVRAALYSGGSFYVAGTHGQPSAGKDVFVLKYGN